MCKMRFQRGQRRVEAEYGHAGYLYTVIVYALLCPCPGSFKLDPDKSNYCSASDVSWSTKGFFSSVCYYVCKRQLNNLFFLCMTHLKKGEKPRKTSTKLKDT